MQNIKSKILELHHQYNVLQQAISTQDWLHCQQYLEQCHKGFEVLFQAPDQQLMQHYVELEVLRERHAEILHAVKKVRDSLSTELGQIRRGKQVQQYYNETCTL